MSDPKVVIIDGKKYVAYEELYNELTPGAIFRAQERVSYFDENDIVMLLRFNATVYNKWICAMLYTESSTSAAVYEVRADDLMHASMFASITYEEYLETVNV
jgi:hypothetical protein